MGELDTLLYACCPKCSKPIGRSKRCDGMELNCPKCGSPLRVVVDQDLSLIHILQNPPFDKPISFVKLFDARTRAELLLSLIHILSGKPHYYDLIPQPTRISRQSM